MNKDKIKNIILVMIVAVISGSLSSILTTNSLSGNKLLGSVSYSDYLDSSKVTYLDSNVQDSIDNLYTQANDYSGINTRVNTLEGYFKNNPTSYFDGDNLNIYSSNNEYRGIQIFDSSENRRGVLYYDPSADSTILVSNNSLDKWGTGELILSGNPINFRGTVNINGVDLSTNNIGIYRGELSSSNNLNDITETGWYRIDGSVPTNAPATSSGYYILLSFGTKGYRTQIIIEGGNILLRRYTGSPATWKSWVKFTGTIL